MRRVTDPRMRRKPRTGGTIGKLKYLLGLLGTMIVGAVLVPSAVGANGDGASLLTSAPSAETAAKKGPKVICIVDWGPRPTGAYRHKPKKCTLHKRGAFPVAGVNTSTIKRMKWKRWNGNGASGRGKMGISTAGLMNVRVKLLRARTRCGVKVFTQAKIKYWGKAYNGVPLSGKYKMTIDNCLR
jgi:hypothetical protein